MFWMEPHPKISAQLIWENKARIVIDFGGGSGLLSRSGVTLGCKVIVILHNRAHMDVHKELTLDWLLDLIKKKNPQILPHDFQQRALALKDPLLIQYEQQKKRKASNEEGSEPKRAALQTDSLISSILGGSDLDSKKPALDEKKPVPNEKKPQAKVMARTPSASIFLTAWTIAWTSGVSSPSSPRIGG